MGGGTIIEFYGLRSKMYSIKLLNRWGGGEDWKRDFDESEEKSNNS